MEERVNCMARRYTQEYVENVFQEQGCVLVSKYEGVDSKNEFICSCGNKGLVSLANFNKGSRCTECNKMKKASSVNINKVDIAYVSEYFKSKDCILLTQEYIDGDQLLDYVCICQQRVKVKFKNFVKGSGMCEKCARKKTSESRSISISEMKKAFEERGCQFLLSTKKGNNYLIEYICHCGHEASAYYSNFLRGHDCLNCKKHKMSGENSPNWNPNLTDEERENGRMIPGYEAWREAVFKRDNYTCLCCKKRGGKLCAHHKDNYSEFPELRIEVSNGVTLCEECHVEFHSIYSYKSNVSSQYEEFLKYKAVKETNQELDFEFQSENKATSIYRGVQLIPNTNGKKWKSVLYYNSHAYHLGNYYTEMEAAAAYNLKAIEMFGEELAQSRLNPIDHNNVVFEETRKSSKYKGVSFRARGKWGVTLSFKDHVKYIGQYDTEEEAAMVYNIHALKHFGEDAYLNPVDHTKYVPKKRAKYFGVYYEKSSNKYRSFFQYQGKRYNLGYFKDELEAAKAYDEKAFEIMKDERKLNFPENFSEYFK